MAAFPDGAPCWADAMLPDLEAGKRFYGEVLGWTFQEGSADYGYYTQAFSDDRNVAALAPTMPGMESVPPAWNIYFASTDADATARRIRDAGGQVNIEPMTVGEFGRMMIAQDPVGTVFGVWQAGSHTGFQKTGEPGSFAWADICVWETEAVDAFYPKVFPLQAKRMDAPAGVDFKIFEANGAPVAGRYRMTGPIPRETPPHVLVYFAVGNCDESLAKLRSLGGDVRSEPMDTPFGRFAVVSDQQDAVFGVIDPSAAVGERPTLS